MAQGRLKLPKRLYPKCLAALCLGAAVVGSLFYLVGAVSGAVFDYLGLAALCVALASLAWEVVERRVADGQAKPGFTAWLAFPLAVSFGLAALPFLVLVVYPDAESHFTTAGRVTARISEAAGGPFLELDFPAPTTERGGNLRLNSSTLPDDYLRDHRDLFSWRSPRTLSVRIAPLLGELGLENIEKVGINLLPGVERFTYVTGKTVPQQTVQVRLPAVER